MLQTGPQAAIPPVVFVPAFDRRGYLRSPITLPEFRRGTRPPNAGRRFPPEPLKPNEVYAMLDACGDGLAARRNRALIALYWRTGLRCAEALDLYPKDVDLDNGRVAVLHGKGDKRRVVAIDPAGAELVRAWEIERSELGFDGTRPYFCVITGPTAGQHVNAPYVRELVKILARRAGITKRVHVHGLRHTYASHLLDSGVPIHFIRRMLGHCSLAVTERYADHINPAEVLAAMQAVSWPER